MEVPVGYTQIDNYANRHRIPIDVAIEKVKSGEIPGKEVGGEWYVSEGQPESGQYEPPGIIFALNSFAVIILSIASIMALVYLPSDADVPKEAFIFPVTIMGHGIFISLLLCAFAKCIGLLDSIRVSLKDNS